MVPDLRNVTEDDRLRLAVQILVAGFRKVGNPDGVARSKILAALGGLFDGSFRRRKQVEYWDVDGKPEPFVSTQGVFLVVAGEHGVNLYSAAAQARWSCVVRAELDRLLGREGRP